MTDSKENNPYSSPMESTDARAKNRKLRAASLLYIWPFFLAHLVYWPTFALVAKASTMDYGVTAAFTGIIALGVSGAIYGFWVGMRLRARAEENVQVAHPLNYVIGQAIWFVFCVFAPCAFLVGAAAFSG